jgi:acyl dehydratase
MSLDASVVGLKIERREFKYDWKTTALYALGIGARRSDLDFLYEGRGPQVFPSFAVIPPATAVQELFEGSGGDATRMVHGTQRIRLHRPLPPAATVISDAWISGLYDLKRLAELRISTRSEIDGELAFETEWTLLYLDDGGFGGPPPPKSDAPKVSRDAIATFVHEDATSPEQALLYRLSGDVNPLHADPEFAARAGFPDGPILHGLCTFGYAARAVIAAGCAGDATRLVELGGQFRKPVWPGDTIRTSGYDLGGGKLALQVHAGGRPDPVMTNCWAVVRPLDE